MLGKGLMIGITSEGRKAKEWLEKNLENSKGILRLQVWVGMHQIFFNRGRLTTLSQAAASSL